MTRTEWFAETRPDRLFATVQNQITDRQCFLFAAGCLKLANPYLTDDNRKLILWLESAAEGLATRMERRGFVETVSSAFSGDIAGAIGFALGQIPAGSRLLARQAATMARTLEQTANPTDTPEVHAGQTDLLKELVGYPLELLPWDDAWQTDTVVNLAKTILEENAWERMPILGDCLEEAGCTQGDILSHARGPADVHQKGCWLLEKVLMKPANRETSATSSFLSRIVGAGRQVNS